MMPQVNKPPQAVQLCTSEMRSGGCDAYDVTPFDGCVAIVDAGGCSYETKAANAAAAGAAGILVVAADDELAVMGCRTCQRLPIFGSMISRSDGQHLRRILDSDSTARIMSAACHRPSLASAAARDSLLLRFATAHRPPSAVAIDSSGCARQVRGAVEPQTIRPIARCDRSAASSCDCLTLCP
jgi:hypothetical protein